LAARQKLNSFYVSGVLGVALFIGVVCQSWFAFVVAGAVLLALASHSGVLRFSGRDM